MVEVMGQWLWMRSKRLSSSFPISSGEKGMPAR